jgi:hypothetical protein
VFCNADTPTLLRPFAISVIIEVLHPTAVANAFLLATLPLVIKALMTSIKRVDILLLSGILQNIEIFSVKNLFVITEYCKFAAL